MTYDQFREIVAEAVRKHLSRDKSLVDADLEWETDNLVTTLGDKLRLEGLNIPREPPLPPRRDLSEFEGL